MRWFQSIVGPLEEVVDQYFLRLVFLVSVSTLGLLYWQFNQAQEDVIERTALQHADLYSEAVAAFRTLYTSEVVETAKRNGLSVTHDYQDYDDAIPLPATLSMELGRILGGSDTDSHTRLYSPYPFPWRRSTGGLRDQFARDAWDALSQDPGRPFYRIEYAGDGRVLRYATADVMRPACVDCHNEHADTPRSGWSTGDVRGVLEVSYPLDRASALAQRGTRSTLLFAAPFLLTAALGLGLVGLRKSSRRARALQIANDRLAEEMQQRQEMEAELRLAQKLEAIGNLAAGVAHEINTPMQFIGDNAHFLDKAFGNMQAVIDSYQDVIDRDNSSGNAELLEDARSVAADAKLDFLRRRVPRALEATIEGVKTVSRIIRAMTNFSHVGTEMPVPNDLNKAVEDTVTISKSCWKYIADIETDLAANLPLVPCLLGEINQVVLIIIVNAAHAIEAVVDSSAGEKGLITIRTYQEDSFAVISITDTGSGIPESVRENIFDPFFTTKEVGKGSGQGLSIARNMVVDKHEGSLTFDSEIDKGTTFYVRIPLREPEQATEDSA